MKQKSAYSVILLFFVAWCLGIGSLVFSYDKLLAGLHLFGAISLGFLIKKVRNFDEGSSYKGLFISVK